MSKEILEQLSLVEQVENFFDRIANSIQQWQPEEAEFILAKYFVIQFLIYLFFSKFSKIVSELINLNERISIRIHRIYPNVSNCCMTSF